jgi:hypothetical protein
MNRHEIEQEALSNATTRQSTMNYGAIFAGFEAKGITDIRPRENVFTFNAWKALGRSVKKGEHGVKVVTFIEATTRDTNEAGDETVRSYRKPHTTTVFHISQTEAEGERQARKASKPVSSVQENHSKALPGWKIENDVQVPDMQYPAAEPDDGKPYSVWGEPDPAPVPLQGRAAHDRMRKLAKIDPESIRPPRQYWHPSFEGRGAGSGGKF